ncbi:hypothetical protein V2J09_007870 [Rumex salicifolius]
MHISIPSTRPHASYDGRRSTRNFLPEFKCFHNLKKKNSSLYSLLLLLSLRPLCALLITNLYLPRFSFSSHSLFYYSFFFPDSSISLFLPPIILYFLAFFLVVISLMASQPPVSEEVVEEEPSEPLKYKKWTLKVSVHCEGCKRKVKKTLLGIEGVYTVDVETKLHKATVTGNVDSETLIRKLEKSGKHAELWPEKTEQKESKRSKKKKNKPNEPDGPEKNNSDDSPPAEPDNLEPNKGGATAPPSRVVEVVNSGKPGGNVQFKEVRVEMKKPENQPAGDSPPPPEGADKATTSGGNVGGGGGGKKKKKKGKGGNGNGNGNGNANASSNGGEPANNGNVIGNVDEGPPPPSGQGPPPGYRSPPRSYPMYDHPPPPYYAPPPLATPVYAVSYNTAYPTSSYTASYYANPGPYLSYAYLHQGSDSAEGGASPSDSFEIFSDENPNACSLM